MTCETALELISQSLDEELSPAESAALQEHLRDCAHCRALQTELLGLHKAWDDLEVPVPPELKERVLCALPAQRSPKVLYWKRWGAMAAALVLVALAAWRLPSFLYENAKPQDTTTVTNADASVPENGDAPALGVLSDEVTPMNEALPDYVMGPGVDVNSYVPASQMFDAPAALPTVYDVEANASMELADLGGEMPMTKRASRSDQETVSQQESAEEFDTMTGAAAGNGEGDTAGFPGMRMAQAPEEDVIAVDNSYDAIPEVAAATGDEMWIAAESLEPVTEEPDLFGIYCGVLTLEDGYEPQKSYPALLRENGEVWYALPAEDFAALVEELDAQALPYKLSLSGDNIDPDAPEGLVIARPPKAS